MSFTEVMEHVARSFEALAVAVLVIGLLWSLTYATLTYRRTKDGRKAYQVLRQSLGGVLLLGLEILVAANLLLSVAVEPTLTNVATLRLMVLIRTVLSFSLEMEINGVAPWRAAAAARKPQLNQYLRHGVTWHGWARTGTAWRAGARHGVA